MPCGGPTRHPRPEAHVMRDLAIAAGVSPGRIVVEDRSLRTLENAAFACTILQDRGWREVIIVTDGFHMPRSLLAG